MHVYIYKKIKNRKKRGVLIRKWKRRINLWFAVITVIMLLWTLLYVAALVVVNIRATDPQSLLPNQKKINHTIHQETTKKERKQSIWPADVGHASMKGKELGKMSDIEMRPQLKKEGTNESTWPADANNAAGVSDRRWGCKGSGWLYSWSKSN